MSSTPPPPPQEPPPPDWNQDSPAEGKGKRDETKDQVARPPFEATRISEQPDFSQGPLDRPTDPKSTPPPEDAQGEDEETRRAAPDPTAEPPEHTRPASPDPSAEPPEATRLASADPSAEPPEPATPEPPEATKLASADPSAEPPEPGTSEPPAEAPEATRLASPDPSGGPPDPTKPLGAEEGAPPPAPSSQPAEASTPTDEHEKPPFAIEATRMSAPIPDFSSGPPDVTPPATPKPPAAPEPPKAPPPPAPPDPVAPARPEPPPPASPEPPATLWAGAKPESAPLEPPPPDPKARRSDLRATVSPPDASDVARAIASAAHAMHEEGLVTATTGNVSARDGELIVRITPTALPYDEMSAEDIVTLEHSGWHSPRGREPSTEHRMHLAIYEAREDVHAIVHTHSPHATAWSFLEEELTTGTEDLEHYVGGPVATARHEATGTEEIGAAAVEALGDNRRAALLARHGVVGVGATLQEALDACRVVERQAQIAWLLRK